MPATGRGSRPLEAEGSFFVVATARNGPFVDFSTRFRAITAGSWNAFSVFAFVIETDVAYVPGGTNFSYVKRVRVSTSLATGPTSFSEWNWSGIGAPIIPGSGSWTCSTSGVEMHDEITFGQMTGTEWTGEVQHHNLKEARVYVQVQAGTAFSASLEINGLTVGISGTCTVPKALMPGADFGFAGFIGIKPLWLGGGGTPESASCFLSADILGQPIGVPHSESIPKGGYVTGSRPFGIPNAMNLNFTDGIEVTVTADASNNGFSQSHEGGELVVQLPTEYAVSGTVRAMANAHSDSFEGQTHSEYANDIDALNFTPSVSQTVERRYEQANYRVLFGSFTDTQKLYETLNGAAISANLLKASCDDALEYQCTRLLPRAWTFDGIRLRHNARHVLDVCELATSWTGVTAGGDHLDVDTAVSAAPKRSFAFGEAVTQAYRYLVVDLLAPIEGVSVNAKIEAPSGTFNLNGRGGAAGEVVPIVFDMCALSLSGPVDMRHSRWPTNNNPTTAFAWGIDEINSIELQLPADSGEYEIHEIRLERFTPPRISLLNAEDGIFLTGDPEDGLVYPFVVGDVDGRRALEFFALYRAGDGSPSIRTLADFKYWIDSGQYPGWEVDILADEDLPLVGLGGAGVVDGDSWIRREWDQDQPIPYVKFYAGLRVPPESGDVWGGGGFGGPTPFRVEKILGAGINGLVLNPGRFPVNGCTVKLERVMGLTDAGSGTTDARGRYVTSTPWARSAVQHRATAMRGNPANWPTYDLYTPLRTDRRLSFIGSRILVGRPSYDVSDSQRHLRAFIDEGQLVVGRAGNDLSGWDDTYPGIAAEGVAIAIDKRSRNQELLLLVATEGDLRLYISTTEGRTLTLATTIATGVFKSPVLTVSRPGFRCLYWLDGTVLKGQIRDAANNIVRPTFDAITGVDADGGAAAGESVLQGGRYRMVLLVTVDGDLVQYTSPDGVAWS